ncbi:MAG TPA: M18 family aminopeptidase [bacterium]|nr:M18 family aminopeptidase [bacterium]HPY15713.1 M18 family aminopeptidase [bacterium]
MNSEIKKLGSALIDFLDSSPTAFHATENIEKRLKKEGFSELDESEPWKILPGEKYFVKRNSSSILAFIAGKEKPVKTGFRIAGAHTDSPLLKIKDNGENRSASCIRVTTEIYGGPLVYTWLDRDLGIAGRVMVKSKRGLKSMLVNINRPVAIIPSLAIHMNREANKGFEFNPQNHLQAVLTADGSAKNVLKGLIASELKEKEENIAGMDMFVYDLQKGVFTGNDSEFITCGRLDNLQMCHAILESFLSVKAPAATTVAAFYDNEEIGSKTLMGADSTFTRTILERITALTSSGKDDIFRALSKSFLVSADGAHAHHPNFPEKHDPAYAPLMNKGPVIKFSSSFRYATTAESSSEFEQICEQAGVPCQKIANRSDVPSGSTIGPMSSAALGVKAVDVGNAMWAMHSIRETAGTLDHFYMKKALSHFYGRK